MEKMINNSLRVGNFTSSEIWKLMTKGRDGVSFGEKALTYIREKNIERKMGRSLKTEVYTRDLAWGNFLEMRVFTLLGLEYEICSQETKTHDHISYWAGTGDLVVGGVKVSDIKCYQPKNFADYTEILLQQDVAILKKERPEEYWQLISNAIINNVNKAEAIAYMPYKSELQALRDMAYNYDGGDQWKYRFIYEADEASLAWLPDEGGYKNLNKFEFDIPQEDKLALSERVALAGKMLVPFAQPIAA